MNVSNEQAVQRGVESVAAVSQPVRHVANAATVISPGQELVAEIGRCNRGVSFRIIAAFALGGAGWAYCIASIGTHPGAYSSIFISPFISMLAVITVAMRRRMRERIRPFVVRATECSDMQSIGALVDALQFENPLERGAPDEALSRLLPLITPEEARQLTGAQRTRLRAALSDPAGSAKTEASWRRTARRSVEFHIGVLHALAAAGDVRSLRPIERLSRVRKRSADGERAAAAAVEALALLREQIRLANTDGSLLRPSQQAAPEMLVRAADCRGETEVAELVRADTTDGP